MESINICKEVADISDEFEKTNSLTKRQYLAKNILLYNFIVSSLDTYLGSFGTGYPFYALNSSLDSELPVIEEQLRYNQELRDHVDKSEHTEWNCADCLKEIGFLMPDLKQFCKPCPNMDDELKPRKVINRLQDMDLWMICQKKDIEATKMLLTQLFKTLNFKSSDIDPLQTIKDAREIVENIKMGLVPLKNLPIDSHIIDYETLYDLISKTPETIRKAFKNGKIPYLPILPLSYRKSWQYDDTAYNFIHDYIYALTEFELETELKDLLDDTRREIADSFSVDELYECSIITGPSLIRRRNNNPIIKERFKERVESWKR